MRKNKAAQQAGITQDELLALLEQSERPGFTKPRLTKLTSEGLLPPLRRTSQAGTKKPVYLWEPEVFERAAFLYDLIEQKIPHRQLSLALWLFGYDVPFEPLLRRWREPIDALLHNLTGETQDPETTLDQISLILAEYIEPKWRFSPRKDEVNHAVGIPEWRALTEFLFDVLVVPDFKPDEEWSEELQGTLQKINTIAQTDGDPKETLSWVLFLREIFALPRYREALTNATVEEWTQARDDYQMIYHLLHRLAALFPRRNARITDEMRLALFLGGGHKLPPLLLAVRHAGYGDQIDNVLSSASEFFDEILDTPAMRKVLAWM